LISSVLGIAFGYLSLRSENTRTALAGVVISILGVVITIVYSLFLFFLQK